jgi:hypothetical protein
MLNLNGQKITEWFYSELNRGTDCGVSLIPIRNSTDFYMTHCHPDTSINGSRKYIVRSLARVDISGQIKWKRWLAGSGFRNLWRVKELPNGDVMVAGQWDPRNPEKPYTKYGWLSRYSSEGEPLWESFILNMDTSQIRIEDFLPARDGGFYCTGMFASYKFNGSDIAFFKTDSFGCIQPGCHIFADVEEEMVNPSGFMVYPNPATEKLFIESNHTLRQNLTLQLISMTGQEIKHLDFPKSTHIFHEISLEGIPKGFYILRLVGENGNFYAKKILIQ